MSVATEEQLSNRLAEDLIWRKRELTTLAKLVSTASRDRETVLVRSLVAILYAHWEGFIRHAAEYYLQFLAKRRLAYSDLAPNFVALGLQARVRDAASRTNIQALAKIIDDLQSGAAERSRLPRISVGAESNLSSRVLHDLTVSLGISYERFGMKKVLIDDRLVRNRNRIAHGEYVAIDVADVLLLKQEIIELMECFRDEIENSVAQSRYRRQSASGPEVSSAARS